MLPLYKILKQIRIDRGYVAEAIKTQMGISRRTLYNIECGKTQLEPYLPDLLEALDVPKEHRQWFILQYKRELIQKHLDKLPYPCPTDLKQSLSLLLSFQENIGPDEVGKIMNNIFTLSLPHMKIRPPIVNTALSNILPDEDT